ncbi:ROK family protein [Rhodoplanes roseus]|uniref:Glucokinase n=1 Tax=Rhodoplanes roseus TaxID=29409 RepID=A0A327KNN9_9BRAD|nr:ROK family protein [Rhodoplanes roseus]RAI40509.1 glucokinase [Rhodoplanes roseus]
MPDTTTTSRPSIAPHGSAQLPKVVLDSYNEELTDDEGFVGDRASRRAFRSILERWRKPLRDLGDDPFGDEASDKLSKKKLDDLLTAGDAEAAGVVHSAIEDFAQELALVTRRFLKLKAWRDTERIVIGGGFRNSRAGELAIGRASVILKADKVKVDFDMIRHDPDEAGLIGAVHLVPAWMFEAHDAILAVDIGGTNIRVGIVRLNLKKAPDLAKASVERFELWRHGDEKLGRDEAVDRLIDMLKRLINRAAKDDLRLAPFIGIGCPGMIEPDGSIDRGAQNLPGNWESSRFNLPAALHKAIPRIGDHETAILMHNDAVVQGLSQTPFMQDVDHWGVFTIGTGLGNARFTNRTSD